MGWSKCLEDNLKMFYDRQYYGTGAPTEVHERVFVFGCYPDKGRNS